MYKSNFSQDQCKPPDDGRYRPKHVGAKVKHFNVKILIFYIVNKRYICWKKNFEAIKMHGTKIKKISEGLYSDSDYRSHTL